jgi:CBS domain-containing protein
MAVDAAPLFRQLRIDNFPVVEKSGRPVGVLDEKDLLDEGLA